MALALKRKSNVSIPFTIDEESYELKTVDQLSRNDEIAVKALVLKEQRLNAMATTVDPDNTKTFIKIATDLYEVRMSLMTQMTTAPKNVLEELGIDGQVQLIREISKGLGNVEGSDGEDASS